MNTTLVASLTERMKSDDRVDQVSRSIEELTSNGVSVLEVRADLVGDVDTDWLRDRFPGEILYTLRSRAEGGAFAGGQRRRDQRLAEAARKYDLVDLEQRDLSSELLEQIPSGQRLISWHGGPTTGTALRDRLNELEATSARYYKLIPSARRSGDELAPMELLARAKRKDVISFATGEIAVWTRIVAPLLGSPYVYGSIGQQAAAPGQPTVARLREDFGLPNLPEVKSLFGIVGDPVLHSLSPRIHNRAYRELDIAALYLPFQAPSFGEFWLELVESRMLDRLDLPLWGLSVTSPYKEVALSVASSSTDLAEQIGGANTLVLEEGRWTADSTDPQGVLLPLEALEVETNGRRTAVVGCGGAGRAAAFSLAAVGADVTLVNRTPERGESAAIELGLKFLPLDRFEPEGFDLLVNATSLGFDEAPFSVADVAPETVIVDLVYSATRTTKLVQEAADRRLRLVDGKTVLLYQALSQFRAMTGQDLSEPSTRSVLGL